MTGALLSLVIGWTPLRLVQSVNGVPIGVVELERQGDQVVYRARHVFRDGDKRFEARWPVDASGKDAQGRWSELQWLSIKPTAGCQQVREERSGRDEAVCLDDGGAGTLGDSRFRGEWSADGRLVRAVVLDERGVALSQFEVSAVTPRPGADPFEQGFAIAGARTGPLALSPPGPARAVSVEGVSAPTNERCLVAARALATKQRGARVEVGLVTDVGRAWPHAWVRLADGRRVDPTRKAGGPPRDYLAFDDERAGQTFLELLAGARVVQR